MIELRQSNKDLGMVEKRIALVTGAKKGIELADAVEFLLSDKSTFITGQVLVVDGGFTLK